MPRKRNRNAAKSAQVDGDKKEMGGYESKMRMDDMPVDWIEQVLSFLPITDVYKCRSVCKAWYVAADRVLSDWETIVIVIKDPKGLRAIAGKERPVRADKNRIFLKDAKRIKRLTQLVRLKEIFVPDCHFRSKLHAVVDDIVLRNAATLTLLHMRSEQMPLDPKRPVVFHNLRDLECSLMNTDHAAACPRLVKLRTSILVKGLHKLPAETLTCLHIDDLFLDTGSPEEIEQVIAAFARFTRLKSLVFVEVFRCFAGQWTELHDQAFSKLFTNMKELEEVEITFPEGSAVNVDSAIETLVHNNPSVRSITMHNARMTDAGLRSLSRLTGLQHLDIESLKRRSNITTEGILSLLRGGSRNGLRDVKLSISDIFFSEIRAEVQLMQQETRCSLIKLEAGIHNISIAIKSVRVTLYRLGC